jgi:hypothetical protein
LKFPSNEFDHLKTKQTSFVAFDWCQEKLPGRLEPVSNSQAQWSICASTLTFKLLRYENPIFRHRKITQL